MQSRSLATALLALGATALLLTGCSQQSTDKPTTKPSASASVADPGAAAPYENACDGTQAVLSGNGTPRTIKDCDAVAVVASGSKITVGTAKSMVVEGSNNDVSVKSLESVTLLGSNNTVHVDGDDPTVVDQGKGNTID